HNTAWWPDVKDSFETFVREHQRDPFPKTLTWQSDGAAEANRAHWLVIDKVTGARGGTPLPDLNDLKAGSHPNFGVRADGMRIVSVADGSNAAAFGLKSGDVVVSVNSRTLPQGLDLVEFLTIFEPGASLTFGVSRDNKPIELKGTFKPSEQSRLVSMFPRT